VRSKARRVQGPEGRDSLPHRVPLPSLWESCKTPQREADNGECCPCLGAAPCSSEFGETFAGKSVEVKPQAVLQTDSHSRSRHPISVPFVSENTCWNSFAAVGGVLGRS
jgi:hypothetical protein